MSAPAGRKRFTVEEANRTLPTLRDVVETIQDRMKWMNAHKPRLDYLVKEYRIPCESPVPGDYFASLVQVRAALGEMESLGCQLKDIRMGTVDFPARLFGKDVLLCWTLGEEKVAFYHTPQAGYAGRQPIPRNGGKRAAWPGDPSSDEGH